MSKIFLGIKNVISLKLGLSDAKIYLGDKKIFPKEVTENEN